MIGSCEFELRLFEPKSPLPGNGISWAETKAPRMGLPVAHFLAAAGCGFELRLFEPKSPLPGNGISWAETKAPKRARRFKDAIARTIPPIRGYSPEPGNLR